MRTASAPSGLKTTLAIILPLGLAAGFMLGGVGTLVYPPLNGWAASLACAGEVEILSDYYTTPSGGSGVQRHITCVSGAGASAVREDITMMTIGIAFLVYAALAFALLQLFAAPRIRRRAEARGTYASFGGGGIRTQGVGSSAELDAILAQVAGALRSGEAEVNVRTVTIDAPGGPGIPGDGADPAERLARLRQLHEAGLIGDEEHAAKKAEILAGL